MIFGMKFKMCKVVYPYKLLLFSKTTNLTRLDLLTICLNNKIGRHYLSLTRQLRRLNSKTSTKDSLLLHSPTIFNQDLSYNNLKLYSQYYTHSNLKMSGNNLNRFKKLKLLDLYPNYFKAPLTEYQITNQQLLVQCLNSVCKTMETTIILSLI